MGHSPLRPTGTQAAGGSANLDVAAPPSTQTQALECFAPEVRLVPSASRPLASTSQRVPPY